MYVSLILAYLGEAGFLVQIWPVIVLPFMLYYLNYVVIPLEEDLLKKEFGEEYERYCKQVRRWL
jgi:protein-S-isoprenylcysteine O-methyltransferase Ste14